MGVLATISGPDPRPSPAAHHLVRAVVPGEPLVLTAGVRIFSRTRPVNVSSKPRVNTGAHTPVARPPARPLGSFLPSPVFHP